MFRRSCEINRPSEMKLPFLFFSSTSTLTIFEIAIDLIPLLMVGLYILFVYIIEFSSSNDDD